MAEEDIDDEVVDSQKLEKKSSDEYAVQSYSKRGTFYFVETEKSEICDYRGYRQNGPVKSVGDITVR